MKSARCVRNWLPWWKLLKVAYLFVRFMRSIWPARLHGWLGLVRRCLIPFASQTMSNSICREYAVFRLRGCSVNGRL